MIGGLEINQQLSSSCCHALRSGKRRCLALQRDVIDGWRVVASKNWGQNLEVIFIEHDFW